MRTGSVEDLPEKTIPGPPPRFLDAEPLIPSDALYIHTVRIEIKTKPLISAKFPLDRVAEAFQLIRTKRDDTLKVLLDI